MVVGNLAVTDDDVMRQHSANSFVESAANRILWNFEIIHVFVLPACNSSKPARRNTRPRKPHRLGSTFSRDHVRSRCSTSESSTRIDFGKRHGFGQMLLHLLPWP